MNWTLVSAVNRDDVATRCLLASPGIRSAADVVLQRGHAGAALAYNAGMTKAKTDLIVFAHQDMYLPERWPLDLENALRALERSDPHWGVLGAWGPRASGERVGFVYDGGWRRVLGHPYEGGVEVDSLDEVLLVTRKSAGLRFDPAVPGFHMYGADICLESRKRQGRKCYAISAFCIHNTNQYGMLPWAFWKSYLAMRRKWRDHLPIRTSCTEITRGCWPMVQWNAIRAINLATGRDKPPVSRLADPADLYEELVRSGSLETLAPCN